MSSEQKFPTTELEDTVYYDSFNTRVAESFEDVREAVSLNEPKMCA